MPALRSRIGRGALTWRVTSAGRSRMIAAANRSWAASDRSGPVGAGAPEPAHPDRIATQRHDRGGQPPQQDLHAPMMPTGICRGA